MLSLALKQACLGLFFLFLFFIFYFYFFNFRTSLPKHLYAQCNFSLLNKEVATFRLLYFLNLSFLYDDYLLNKYVAVVRVFFFELGRGVVIDPSTPTVKLANPQVLPTDSANCRDRVRALSSWG